MATVHRPELPAVPDYPTESSHVGEVDAARRLFLKELASPDAEWEDQGEREGVQLWSKADPEARLAVLLGRRGPALTTVTLASRTLVRTFLLICTQAV